MGHLDFCFCFRVRAASLDLQVRVMKKLFFLVIALLSGCVKPACGQTIPSVYDVACPPGSTAIQQTTVPQTGHIRSWACVDQNGVVTLQGAGGLNAPTTSFSYSLNVDRFTRANAANLGSLWTAESGSTSGSPMQIVSNTAQPSSNTNNAASFWSINSFANNQWAEAIANTATASGFAGAIVRASSGDNYYRCDWQLEAAGAGQARIDKVVGGTFTALASNSSLTGQTSSSLIHFEVIGTTLSCYVNGALVVTTTDASLSSGSPGITAFLTTSTLTNFRGGDLIWTMQGTVIATNQTNTSGTGNFEPSVLYESGCTIVSSPCFKMWHSDGWTVCNTDYAESVNGVTWVESAKNPVMTGACHGFETKIKGVYYAYTANTASPPQSFDQWTSPDGATWTKAHSAVLSAGSATWNSFDIFNPYVWVTPAGTWMMFYDGSNNSVYSVGLASSPDGVNWTNDASNPILTNGAGSVSSVDLHQVGATYYAFLHTAASGQLPSDVALYSSTDLHTWTASPRNPIVERTLSDEGANVSVGQLADSAAVEVNGTTYLFNDAGNAQSSGVFHINLRTTPHPLSDLLPASMFSCRCQ